MRNTVVASALGLALIAGPAWASEERGCTTAPKEQWQSLDQVKGNLVQKGLKVREIEFDGTCIEAEVESQDGKRSELKLDPVTAATVAEEDED